MTVSPTALVRLEPRSRAAGGFRLDPELRHRPASELRRRACSALKAAELSICRQASWGGRPRSKSLRICHSEYGRWFGTRWEPVLHVASARCQCHVAVASQAFEGAERGVRVAQARAEGGGGGCEVAAEAAQAVHPTAAVSTIVRLWPAGPST